MNGRLHFPRFARYWTCFKKIIIFVLNERQHRDDSPSYILALDMFKPEEVSEIREQRSIIAKRSAIGRSR